ncbi:MAG: Type secretion system protein [Patescibacteria group bacterium]|nr:Type secretion system protein [Patescibacteria group bacterium]
MKQLHFKVYTKVKAFTLIETLMATFIISMVVLGPLTVSITASSYARDTKGAIIANYLAHEGLELVRFKRDSIVVECLNSAPTCTLLSFNPPETVQQGAWRIFKERMGSQGWENGFPPCFVGQSTNEGCAFDVYGTVVTGGDVGERYLGESGDECSSLYIDDRKDKQNFSNSTGVDVTDWIYVCKDNGTPLNYSDTGYKRIIKMTQVTLPSWNDYQKMYEDDIRVESIVTYRKNAGVIKTVRVIDYLHARP